MFQKCADYKASEIPTFARIDPPDSQVKIVKPLVVNILITNCKLE